jgi:hypothetical protein
MIRAAEANLAAGVMCHSRREESGCATILNSAQIRRVTVKAYSLALAVLLSSLALGQTAPAPQKSQAAPAPKKSPAASQPATVPSAPPTASAQAPEPNPSAVPADAAVITIDGLCQAKNPTTGECKTVVTRAQFDKLLGAVSGERSGPPQQIPAEAKRQLGMRYAQMLTFATEAEKRGLDKNAEAQELFHLMRLQVLAQIMGNALQQQSQPSADEVQKYYNDNAPRYTELTIQRVLVPIRPVGEGKTNEADMKKLADDLRQRAAGGAEFKTLQAEAFEKAGLPNPPETKQVLQAQAIPPTHQAVRQLKPGEVSQVIQDPTGLYIYKLESQRQIPLEQVKPEIERTLGRQKAQQQVETLMNSTKPVLNPQYFGEAPQGPPGMGLRGLPGPPSNSAPAANNKNAPGTSEKTPQQPK